MKNRLVWTLVGLAVTCGVSASLVLWTHHEPIQDSAENISHVEKEEEKPEISPEGKTPQEPSGYTLKECNGKIGVYTNSENPDMVLDVFVKYLPDYDRNQLEQGIFVESYDQLVALIEDYIS